MAWNSFQQSEPRWIDPQFHSGTHLGQLAELIAKQNDARKNAIPNAIASALPTLAKAYQGWKADKIANNLLQQQDPEAAAQYKAAGLTGQAAADMLDQDQQYNRQATADELNNRYKEAQIAHLNAPDSPDSPAADPQSPRVDPKTGLIWNGRQWVHPIGETAKSSSDPVYKKYGLTPDDVASVSGTPYVNAAGEPISTEDAAGLGNKAFAVVTPPGKPSTRIPVPEWGNIMQRNANLRANNPAQQAYQSATGNVPLPTDPGAPTGSTPMGPTGVGGYQPGKTYNGILYIGGDPNDPSSWQQ